MKHLNQYLFKVESELDLNFCICGHEKCHPDKRVGPYAPDFYILHFIVNGYGTYRLRNKTFNLQKDQGFLIYPNEVCYYKPETKSPWSYYWVGFKGNSSNSIADTICSIEKPIFTYNTDAKIIVQNIYKFSKKDTALDLKTLQLTSYLYSLIYQLTLPIKTHVSSTVKQQQYLTYALHYISQAYHRHLTVEEIADYVHIDRTHLFNLFKLAFNTSPKQFIINYRIDKAAYFLKNTELSAKEISYSVGYKDYSLFSRMFKKVKGESPNKYRNK